MIIKNVTKAENYQLSSDTKIEVERTNPFFHDYGEQSVPFDLPDTPQNRRILNNPQCMQNSSRPASDIDVTVEDGGYYASARQAILSVKAGDSIKTSLYMNDGSFYSRFKKTTLKEVFGTETVPDVSTVDAAIQFCRDLISHANAHFDIFPILVDNDNATAGMYATLGYKMINCYGEQDNNWWYPRPKSGDSHSYKFFNDSFSQEFVGETMVLVPKGYYISPFIRVNYVLERVLSHFGYTLDPGNFFSVTAPFSKMVLINNTMDAIVTGKIYLSDLVPDVTCIEFLDWFRKKFCCEFVPADTTVKVVFLKDILAEAIQTDLSKYSIEKPTVDYSASPRHIKISYSGQFDSDSDQAEQFDTLSAMQSKYPNVKYDAPSGRFYREGFYGAEKIKEWLGFSNMTYEYLPSVDDESVDIEIPESIISMRSCNADPTLTFPYVGKYRSLHSKILLDNGTTMSDVNTDKLPIIVAIPYTSTADYPRGGVGSYDYYRAVNNLPELRLFLYSLSLWGEDGLYEKFYRQYDLLLRNTLYPVTATLNLPSELKRSIPAHRKVGIDGAEMLIDVLKFSLGGKPEPIESQLLTTQLYEPVTAIPSFESIFINTGYHWIFVQEQEFATLEEWYAAEDWTDSIKWERLFPPLATADLIGVQYGLRKVRDTYLDPEQFTWQKINLFYLAVVADS